jgi:type IV secretory pathway VirB10-like protein
MSIHLGGAKQRGAGRPPAAMGVVVMLLAVGIGIFGVWSLSGRDKAAAATMSPEGQKLVDKGEARRAQTRSAAERLQQEDVGEGYQFDSTGQLLGVPADGSDLPENRRLAAVTAPAAAAAASAPGAGAAAGGVAGPAGVPGEVAEGVRHERPGESATAVKPEETDRSLLTHSMLAYSTVKSATWAERRPQGDGESRPSGGPGRPEDRQGGDEQLLKGMERLVSASTPGMAGGGLGEVAQSGPSKAGEALYPAERSTQAFPRGGVGDMRIGRGAGPDEIVRQGKFLDCVLVNELRVDLVESPVIAMVTRDFLTLNGGFVLVPAGAKLIGTAGTVQNLQQVRVYLKFERIIFPDQRTAFFPERQVGAVDGMGAVGIAGDVDRHFMLQFGAAVMLGVLDGLAGAIQSPTAVGSPGARDLILARTSANFSTVLAGILQRYANVVPTETVEPAMPLKVFFAEDVKMSPYMRSSELSWMR